MIDYTARDKITLIIYAQLGERISAKEADDLLHAIKEDKLLLKFLRSKSAT